MTAEGDSAATLGCGFRGVRRESEGKSRGRSLQLRVRLPLAGRDDDQGGMTPPTLLLGCLRAPGGRGSHGSWWTRVSVVLYSVSNKFNLNKQNHLATLMISHLPGRAPVHQHQMGLEPSREVAPARRLDFNLRNTLHKQVRRGARRAQHRRVE